MNNPEELLRQMTEKGVAEVAKSMGITTLALAVICKENNISWPGIQPDTSISSSRDHDVKEIKTIEIPAPSDEDRIRGYLQLNRKLLYELVWIYPAVKLASTWGISDVGLGKVCK